MTVENGSLVITARMIDGVLSSGGIGNRTSLSTGRWEVRVRADPDPSGVTSAVALTWPTDGTQASEYDFWETLRHAARNPIYIFHHYGRAQDYFVVPISGQDWHVAAMEREPHEVRYYIDDKLIGTVTDPAHLASNPHSLRLQLDPFAPTMPTTLAPRMQVDWARISKKTAAP